MLKEFARAEVSIENVRIWDAIQNYRTAPNYEERLQLAHHIYNTFLAPDAPMEVNITKKTIEAVWKNIEDGCMCEWLFDRVEKEVRECLEDMLKRFIQTEEYQSFMEQCKKEKRKSQRFSQVLQGFKFVDVNI
jgi:histone H3/H4